VDVPRIAPRAALLVVATLSLLACAPAGGRSPTAAPAPGAPAPAPSAPATPAPPERLPFGVSTPSATYAGIYAAMEAGLFARAGLDAEVLNLGAGAPAQAALLSGELQVAAPSGTSTINALLAGGDLSIVGAVFDTMPFQLVAVPSVTSAADLRDKVVGINRLGGSPHAILRYMLRDAGLDPETDVRILQVGGQAERVAALRSGAVQATIVDPPFSTLGEREGLRLIADAADLGLAYPHAVLTMNREWLRTRRDTARRVLQTVVDGTRAFKSDRELGSRALQRWLQIEDPALLDEAYAYFSRTLPTAVLPSADGLQRVLDEAAADQPAARTLRPQDLLDATLAQEVR
jgi:NitT/TauT family transport system substrate-binding protein